MKNLSSLVFDPLVFSSRSDIEPIDPNEVSELVTQTVVEQYFQVATLTVLVYDAGKHLAARRDLTVLTDNQVITLDKEVCNVAFLQQDKEMTFHHCRSSTSG